MSPPPQLLPRRIVLTGFMGSGKSTVGPILAQQLGWRFIDVDDIIEAEAGKTIAEIFAEQGEGAFRDLEHATIARLASGENLVLALGGGAIERQDTRTLLMSAIGTLVVHLQVELLTSLKRCTGTEGTRPVLADHANLRMRYERRLPLYKLAHLTVRSDNLSPRDVARQVLEAAGLWSDKDFHHPEIE